MSYKQFIHMHIRIYPRVYISSVMFFTIDTNSFLIYNKFVGA